VHTTLYYSSTVKQQENFGGGWWIIWSDPCTARGCPLQDVRIVTLSSWVSDADRLIGVTTAAASAIV
jgi:hypothetical protein